MIHWVECTHHKAVSQKASLRKRSQMSFLRFHRSSDFKLPTPKNGLTLWGEYTHHKAVAQKTSLQFSSEDVSFFNTSLWVLLNTPSQITQRQSFQTGKCSVSCNSVRWIHRTQSSFSESFLPVLNGRYFLFHHSPLWASKYPFANSTRTALAKGFLRGKL